jgi:hypothetical protein
MVVARRAPPAILCRGRCPITWRTARAAAAKPARAGSHFDFKLPFGGAPGGRFMLWGTTGAKPSGRRRRVPRRPRRSTRMLAIRSHGPYSALAGQRTWTTVVVPRDTFRRRCDKNRLLRCAEPDKGIVRLAIRRDRSPTSQFGTQVEIQGQLARTTRITSKLTILCDHINAPIVTDGGRGNPI